MILSHLHLTCNYFPILWNYNVGVNKFLHKQCYFPFLRNYYILTQEITVITITFTITLYICLCLWISNCSDFRRPAIILEVLKRQNIWNTLFSQIITNQWLQFTKLKNQNLNWKNKNEIFLLNSLYLEKKSCNEIPLWGWWMWTIPLLLSPFRLGLLNLPLL